MGQILYYSLRCKYCKELLDLISKSNVKVEKINIDVAEYPDYVKSVPTLVSPTFTKPLVGKPIFDWVYNQTYFNNTSNNINISKTIKIPKDSELLTEKVNKERLCEKNKFCDITESTNLLI